MTRPKRHSCRGTRNRIDTTYFVFSVIVVVIAATSIVALTTRLAERVAAWGAVLVNVAATGLCFNVAAIPLLRRARARLA